MLFVDVNLYNHEVLSRHLIKSKLKKVFLKSPETEIKKLKLFQLNVVELFLFKLWLRYVQREPGDV